MARFVKSSDTVYEWDSEALAREVPKKMALIDVDASTLAQEHLQIRPQLLCDLTAGRRRWTFELVRKLVNIKPKA